ncbi:MAG: S41 family peptidase, partial [Planctomycetes bacterium]|nr:S41 family peptidase [Planctomycetota bacterium]
MSPRTLAWILFFAGLLALIMRVQVATMGPEGRTLVREQSTYQAMRRTISERYVDKVNEKELFYGAMQGMAGVLDRHTVFWTPEQYEMEKTETSGHFAGIGIEIRFDDQKNMIIVTPIAGTPAFNAKLMPGDRILKIDDESIEKLSQEEASKRVRGAPGTQVKLTVAREGVEGNLNFTITRAVIKVESVQEACVLVPPLSAAARIPADTPKIGYIQVAAFQEETSQDLEKAIEQMRPLGLQALIIDLRQNRGGLLDTAVGVCDLFLNEGVIVTTRERPPLGEERIYSATKKSGAYAFPLAVLIDSYSASASEIVAGCMHDHGRGVLVGEKSYGKGSVQTIIP